MIGPIFALFGLAITCHYITEDLNLSTVVLGVRKFPMVHTAANIAEVKTALMTEWGITGKVTSMVTDCAANMVACANILDLRHVPCFAHRLNLVVKKAISDTIDFDAIRSKARKIVYLFRFSCKAKEKLCEVQTQMGLPEHKLIKEVDTRWNSTYDMLQRVYEQRAPLSAALSSLTSDIVPFTAEDYNTIEQCLLILKPFKTATVELSEEKRVSGSKVIPMVKMLKHINTRLCNTARHPTAITLANNILRNLNEKFAGLERTNTMSLATILDPRFKEMGFCSSSSSNAAVDSLVRKCASIIPPPQPTPPPAAAAAATNDDDNIWGLLDHHVVEHGTNATANAIAEVQR